MAESKDPLLLDHNYDGIQELDHPLPRWWLMILYGTIVFGVIYSGYYFVGPGLSERQELAANLDELHHLQASSASPRAAAGEALMALMMKPESIQQGAAVFAGKCVPCHGDHAQGVIGPNLTDDYWIHGTGSPEDVIKVITEGVPDKGMPPWGPILSGDDNVHLAAFIRSVHDTHPANAKEQQGTLQAFK